MKYLIRKIKILSKIQAWPILPQQKSPVQNTDTPHAPTTIALCSLLNLCDRSNMPKTLCGTAVQNE